MRERGSEVYWLLPRYSSTTKEVKSGAISYSVCLTYILRENNRALQTIDS